MAVQPDLIARGLGALPSQVGLGSASPRFRVYIRDGQYRRVAELSEWTSFRCVPWFNDVGTWELECSSQSAEAALLAKDGGVIVTRELEGVERTVFSGFVWTEWGYTETTFRASGYSDEALLWTPARPNPELASPPFTSDYWVLTGPASTVMRQLVALNIGPTAPAPWAIAALNPAPDPVLGSTVTGRANLQPIITLLAELAITPYAGGLGFYLRQSDNRENEIEFDTYAPPDRSETAKFSVDLGTAASYEDVASAPEANHVFVMGGDGFGANRTIIEEQDDDSIAEWGKIISTVVDLRGVTDTGELNQRAAEEIAKVSTLRRTAVVPFDVPSLQYGRDYDLGTLVTVVTRSGEVVDLIRQVEIDLDPERGAIITPIVGQGDGSDEERTATMIRTIRDRVSNVERNWNVPPDSITNDMLHAYVKVATGDYKLTASATEQPGWLLCDGRPVSRTAYAALFLVIGTQFGAGDGVTTFNLPNFEDRVPIGAGNLYALNAVGGSSTSEYEIPAHDHGHSHGGGTLDHVHASQAHTHPGSHSHPLERHYHEVNIAHNHASFNTGSRSNSTPGGAFRFEEPNVSSGTEDHTHEVDVPAYAADVPSQFGLNDSDDDEFDRTGIDSDQGNYAAVYTGSPAGVTGGTWSGGTDPDATEAGGVSGSVSTIQPYVAVHYLIFAGA